MPGFDLHLQSATQYEVIHDVISFVGEDASGQFGIFANHARMMTCLKFGLSWFRYADQRIEYLALPGAVVYFTNNQLYISTRHYFRDHDYEAIQLIMEKELHREEESLMKIKDSLHRLDEEILKRLWDLKRQSDYDIK